MKNQLPSTLSLGSIKATLVNEDSLVRVEACMENARDYFGRLTNKSSFNHLALERLTDALADINRRLFILEDKQGKNMGLLELALDTPEPREATLVLLVLANNYRGRGLGREVMSTLCPILAHAGFTWIRLGVVRGESGATNFWTSIGMWEREEETSIKIFELPLTATTS